MPFCSIVRSIAVRIRLHTSNFFLSVVVSVWASWGPPALWLMHKTARFGSGSLHRLVEAVSSQLCSLTVPTSVTGLHAIGTDFDC